MIDITPAKAEVENDNEAVAFTETENNPTEMVGDEDIDHFKDTDPKKEVKILPCESCLKFYNYQRDLADGKITVYGPGLHMYVYFICM